MLKNKINYYVQMKMNREMFEGKDYPTQWALNSSMYQNMSNDQGICAVKNNSEIKQNKLRKIK